MPRRDRLQSLAQRHSVFAQVRELALHRNRHLVSMEGIAPLTYECHVQEPRMIKRMTQGLGALVTGRPLDKSSNVVNKSVSCSHFPRGYLLSLAPNKTATRTPISVD
jgi:hypothetical protein